jgi:excisionase family DNA binding protein
MNDKISVATTVEPAALKARQAGQFLGGLSVPTIHRMVKRGVLNPVRTGRHLLFPVSELNRFLHDGMTGTSTLKGGRR